MHLRCRCTISNDEPLPEHNNLVGVLKQLSCPESYQFWSPDSIILEILNLIIFEVLDVYFFCYPGCISFEFLNVIIFQCTRCYFNGLCHVIILWFICYHFLAWDVIIFALAFFFWSIFGVIIYVIIWCYHFLLGMQRRVQFLFHPFLLRKLSLSMSIDNSGPSAIG